MKVIEFYETIEADYYEVFERMLRREELISKFLKKYTTDMTFSKLEDAMNTGSVQDIFKAAHSLKGVVANLGLKPLVDEVGNLVEITRTGESDGISKIFENIRSKHFDIIKLIETLD